MIVVITTTLFIVSMYAPCFSNILIVIKGTHKITNRAHWHMLATLPKPAFYGIIPTTASSVKLCKSGLCKSANDTLKSSALPFHFFPLVPIQEPSCQEALRLLDTLDGNHFPTHLCNTACQVSLSLFSCFAFSTQYVSSFDVIFAQLVVNF
jgi:hypothetical protein